MTSPHHQRRGLTTPLVAVALLVAMLGLALILDRLWLEAARLELTTAAEAAALSAARELASDRRLVKDFDYKLLCDEAVQSAMMTAVQNRVAGQPLIIDEADITFPGSAVDTDAPLEINASETPVHETVVVAAHRTRFRGNPIALFVGELTGQPYGNAVGQAGATIFPNVVGVRPLSGSAVPALPLAIWKLDPTGQRTDTWDYCIEQRRGRDEFGFDPESQSVASGGDGIPELTLRTARPGGPTSDANVQLLDIGTQFVDRELIRQLQIGWTSADLESWGGELNLPSRQADLQSSSSLTLAGLPQLEDADRDVLEQILGEPRIALLYSSATEIGESRTTTVNCVRMVALRVLLVSDQQDGSCRVTIQPTVLATRTALVQAAAPDDEADSQPSTTPQTPSYIYRLQLTQ